MDKYNDIIVGSGISGLTIALILAMNNRKVLLIEKSDKIGGSLSRFYRKGIPFDTGFHFTGGFHGDTVLFDMLSALSLDSYIKPEFVKYPKDNRFVFENQGESFEFRTGFHRIREDMLALFPKEEKAISLYFSRMKNVRENTIAMDLGCEYDMYRPLDDDLVSLKEVLDSLTDNRTLKTLLSAFSMCHGTEPSKISFANHSRVTYSLYESIARVKNGGDAFIRAFKKKLGQYNVDIRTNSFIASCEDIEKRKVGTFVLNNGTSLKADNCIFTIHPEDILRTFNVENVSKAFADRVAGFEPSIGFFLVFIKFTKTDKKPFDPAVITLYPDNDMEKMFDPEYKGDLPLVMVKNSEQTGKNNIINVINAFELSHYDHVKQWADSSTGRRSEEYKHYKETKVRRICERIINIFPEYEDSIEVVDSASMLTFRDYLNNPYGSAYGIKQKIGQFNLLGRVQYKNTFAAGQSSILPGIVGAMMSGFAISRYILGKDVYKKFIEK